ncbi:MAG: hypothetical protein ACOYK7_16165 [Pirellulales bacterium]
MRRLPVSILTPVGFASLPVLATVVVVATGCSEPAAPPVVGPRPAPAPTAAVAHDHDHDHAKPAGAAHEGHEHPETLAAAVTELKGLVEKVREALAAGDREKADGPVHAVGHLLEDMEGLVAKAKLPAERETAVKQAVEEIFQAFDALDTAIHGDAKEAIDFAPHEEKIGKALGVIGDGT